VFYRDNRIWVRVRVRMNQITSAPVYHAHPNELLYAKMR